jgi:ubiquinone/menaquinone biosynthesis C-methylase UbiE
MGLWLMAEPGADERIRDEPWRRARPGDGGPGILSARTLQTAHRRLATLLRPGQSVLDVGCGPGAITRGIAEAVGPTGRVIGVDLNAHLVDEARRAHGGVPGLTFEMCDVYDLPWQEEFDVVTAARVLQWLGRPLDALRMMTRAAKPGGKAVVLDYNHEKAVWVPDPPPAMRTFYAAFLRWRADAGLDNAIADRLAEMFQAVGLIDIVESPQIEVTLRDGPDFAAGPAMWAQVAAFHGRRMVEDGVIKESQRAAAEAEILEWTRAHAQSQTLYLITVEGVRPTSEGYD